MLATEVNTKPKKKKKKAVVKKKKEVVIRQYHSNRREFIDKIYALRAGNLRIPPKNYKEIAKKLNELGYRNRLCKEITPQFVANIVHRHPREK